MTRVNKVSACLLALALGLSGCYGPFRLTKKLHQWNGEVGGKWANEFVFLVLIWVPVYGLTTLGDALIFNSIEFWTGDNPIDSTRADETGIRTKRIVRKDAEARLIRLASAQGDALIIEQFKAGRPAESLHIERQGRVTVASNAQGSVLYTARTLPDGSIVVSDAEGKPVASRSAEEIRNYRESLN